MRTPNYLCFHNQTALGVSFVLNRVHIRAYLLTLHQCPAEIAKSVLLGSLRLNGLGRRRTQGGEASFKCFNYVYLV